MTGGDAGFDLYLIVDGSHAHLQAVTSALSEAHRGRVALQLRMKGAEESRVRKAALKLRELAAPHGCPLFLNGEHLALARELGVDGVQLPAIRQVPFRSMLGRGMRWGASCHTASEIAQAEADGANFVLLSPFAGVPGKAPPLGDGNFATLACCSRLPVVALGGLGPDNAQQALDAGACAISAIRSVLGAPNPARPTRALLDLMTKVRAADLQSNGLAARTR